jgi:hypothetical protein
MAEEMMVDNEPILAALDVSEAIARRQALGLIVPDVRKCVKPVLTAVAS